MENNIEKAKRWLELESGENYLSEQEHCPTRDVFQARLDKARLTFESDPVNNLDIIYPLIAVIGEIGNNSFDHNIGNWRDVMGIYFDVDFENKTIVIAIVDRGFYRRSKKLDLKPKLILKH